MTTLTTDRPASRPAVSPPPAGWWTPGPTPPTTDPHFIHDAVHDPARPLVFVRTPHGPALAEGGTATLGPDASADDALPLAAIVPAVRPEHLGDPTFHTDHRLRFAYLAGAMANGIGSVEIVAAMSRAGMLGFFGAAGLSIQRIESAIERLQRELGHAPFGINLIHSPGEPDHEAATVDLLLRRDVRLVEASAYLDLTLPVVRYRVAGIRRGPNGEIIAPNHVIAKVSRVEVATKFFSPPPEKLLRELVGRGDITAEQAELAKQIPVAQDVTAEADSGGHTDNRPLVALVPTLLALRDRMQAQHDYPMPLRVGAAGGISTPASVAAAFALGAAYVLTGSVNQACIESGSSDAVRKRLAEAGQADVIMAPAADMFEMGVKVQVLKRGTLFAMRAAKLYEIYRTQPSLEAMPTAERVRLEKELFRAPLEAIWNETRSFWQSRDPKQVERADRDAKHKMALTFRWYLGLSSRWANAGEPSRQVDYQVWCGPAMGAFNEWTKGSFLERPENRRVVTVAKNLLHGAVVVTRIHMLACQGVSVPAHVAPREDLQLESPLAIIGIGCLFPKADGAGAYWANVKNKVDGIGPIPPTHWNPDDYFDADPKRPDFTYAKRGGFLEPVAFNPAEWGIAPNDLEATDTSQLLALVAAQMALRDAGGLNCDKRRVSVILGVTGTLEMVVPLGARLGHPIWRKALKDAGVSDKIADAVVQRISEGYVAWQENSFPGLLGNVVAGRVANRLDLGGTNCVVDAACASSLSAIHLAGMELQTGRADVVVTGGVDTFNDIFMYMCFSKTPALSPTGGAKPFDSAGDGTILGEGLGIVVLKRLADAERDGDRVYAVIKGIGTSSDGKGNAVYAPSPAGQIEALRAAYMQAGVTPDTIELVEAHGTGTRVGDAAEVTALTTVFSDASKKRAWCALGSVKSQIGHTKAAAGAAGLIKAALALHHKVLPPTIKVTRPLGVLDGSPFYVNTECRPWLPRDGHPRRAGVSAFGFGGSNFHCVLEEYAASKLAPDWDGDVQIVALSGASVAELKRHLSDWKARSASDGKGVLPSLAHRAEWSTIRARAGESRATFDPAAAHRLLLVLPRTADAAATIARARELLAANAGQPSWHADGIAYGSGPPGKLGFLFPGQGTQTVGMLRDLACTFPVMQAVLAEADRAFAAQLVEPAERLSDFIYPPPAFTPDGRAKQEEQLRATAIAQPALGAVSLGALQVLAQFALKPDATAGHSYGELTALCAAGCFDAPSLFELSQLRGRLMAETRDDAGAMLAVQAPLDTVEELLTRDEFDLVIANKNGPAQAVLSGRTAEIERAAVALKERRIRHLRLPVAAAFHSPLVSAASTPFRAALEPIAFHTAQLAVYANSTGREYPRAPQAARDLLAGQLARPVEFVDQIRNMAGVGVTTFVEVGPGATLTKLVDSILDGTPHAAVALDASAGKRSGIVDLAHALIRLAALGHPVRLTAWDDGAPPLPPPAAKPTMTVPICGANYRKQKPLPSPGFAGEGPGVRAVLAFPQTEQPPSPPAPLPQSRERGELSNAFHPQSGVRGEKSPRTDPPMANDSLSDALRVTQDSLAAFQRMQEQTAQLHRQFLETQESAQRTLQVLVEGQQRLLAVSLGLPAAAPAIPPPLPPIATAPTARPTENAVLGMAYSVSPPTPIPPVRAEPKPFPPAPAVQAAASPPAPAGLSPDRVQQILLSVVAEKTGYPPEMLNPDMGLDSDLGIDSIKRVEILSALQEKLPDAPPVKPEHLGTLHTLRQIVEFICQGEPGALATESKQTVADASGSDGVDRVLPILRAIVADKTGYPPEMIDPDMGLDSDLGIDSIKRVEILSALQEQLPDAPPVKPEHLGTLQTLRQIAEFLGGQPGTVAEPNPPGDPQAGTPFPKREGGEDQRAFPEISPPSPLGKGVGGLGSSPVANAPGSPNLDRRILRIASLAAERPRVNLAAGADVWLVAEPGPLADAIAASLANRGLQVSTFGWDAVATSPPAALGGLVLVAPPSGDRLALRAFRWLRRTGPALRQSAAAVVATVTQMDGEFGLSAAGPHGDAETGSLAGLTKTARHEWPTVAAKAIDLDPILDPAAAADTVVDELFLNGPVEVGIGPGGRRMVELVTAPLAGDSAFEIGPDDVIVLTGGARGVTAEVAVELAQNRPALVLLGRSPEPAADSPELAACGDEPSIKRFLAGSMPGAAPRQIAERCQQILAGREVRRTLDRIAAAGAKAIYRTVDIRDSGAVAAVLAEVRHTFGPITGIVHGAGVLADRKIDDQTDEQFEAVYSTKVGGLKAVLAATAADPLKLLAVFSSSTGRFGRAGQVAYAAANEAVNKLAQAETRRRRDCRVVAVNWGPWEGGMVTPALRGVFAAEGIGLIPLAAGARHLLAEFAATDRAVETVVLGPGSTLPTISQPEAVSPGSPPRVGMEGQSSLSVAFEHELNLDNHPVLRAHVIDSRAVLPMALTVEWLAHAALHGNPGLAFHGLDDLRIYHPVTVREGSATPVRVHAAMAMRRNGQSRVTAEVRGRRADGREIVHSRAEVILTTELPPAPAAEVIPVMPAYPLDPDDVYQKVLFHGPELRGIEEINGSGPAGIVVTASTAPAPAAWVQHPLRGAWLTDPLALDCAFQAMSVWCRAERGAVSLPSALGRYRQFVRKFPNGSVRVVCRVEKGNGPVVRAEIEFVSDDGNLIARIDGFECVLDAKLNAAFRRNRLERAGV